MLPLPMGNNRAGPLARLLEPEEAMEPVLAKPVREALLDWLEEIWAADRLKAHGLSERRRALFTGAPGTGKTTLAHHLAARLGLPMAMVRPDDIHGKYVGTGTENIAAVFDAVETLGRPVVLFFDEFDTVAQRRMHTGVNPGLEHDHNAMINTLLARLDACQSFIIAATNFTGALDPAVWRRFDVHVPIDLPGHFERMRILERYLKPFAVPSKPLRGLAASTEGATPDLLRKLCEGLRRQAVVYPDRSREVTFARLFAAVHPHPDLPRPPLWDNGAGDPAILALPWPLAVGAA